MSKFKEAYEHKRPALERAVARLKSLLREVVGHIEDRKLVRAEFDDVRPKSLPSLKRKARKLGWTAEDALAQCPDLVAGRIVCNNVEDVYRVEELLKEHLPIDSGPVTRQDYIKNPTARGYRAVHLNFRLNVAQGFGYEIIPCEIQIRSRLQDSWAELSHADIYKQDNLPPDLLDRFKDMAKTLAAADEIASEIRSRVQRITAPPEERPPLDRVSSNAIAYIFKDVFGRAPPDYVVMEALNLCDDLGINSLKGLPDILKRHEFRDALGDAYSKIFPAPIDPETVLLAGLHALANGDRRALRFVRRKAQREFDEIDRIARREMLSELPATVDDLIEQLEDPRYETDIVSLAEALGATTSCARCGATVVDAYSFAEAAIQHYDLSGDEGDQAFERIELAINQSGADTGGFDDSSVCSYCEAQMAKHD
jgi:ppGpp synthetase/RelA/SpoT-type nucleotidyltranferase